MAHGQVFLSARTLSAICDAAEVLGAEAFLRVITDEGLPVPVVRTLVLAPDVEPSKVDLLLQALAAFCDVQQTAALRQDPRRLAEQCFGQLDWRSAAVTLAALQAVEELLWEFGQLLARDPDLDPLPAQRLERSLITDGFTIDPAGRIRPPRALFLDGSLGAVSEPAVIRVLLSRVKQISPDDPMLVIGTAKELVESTAKVVLNRLGVEHSPAAGLPRLVDQAHRALAEHPSCVPDGLDAGAETKRLLGSLMTTAAALAALRNRHGTGHGPAALPRGLRPRHGRLAQAAADAWCTYVLDTLADLAEPSSAPVAPTPITVRPTIVTAAAGRMRPQVIARGDTRVSADDDS